MKHNEYNSLSIQNIVTSGSIADSIDLEFISNNIQNCRLSRKNFPGAVYHMQNPKSVALIFESGRIILTGLMKPEDIPQALENLLHVLKDAGVKCQERPQVAVKNIVCTYNLGAPCNLVRILTSLMDTEMVEYEPECFPGLVCRITDPKIVFLIFSSGKIVITGGMNLNDIKRGLDLLIEKLSIAGSV